MSERFPPILTQPEWRPHVDRLGIGLAGLCALHCAATVLVVSGLGIGGHFLLAHEIHEFGLALAVLVAALAIGWGVRRHRRIAPLLIAGLGLLLMTGGLFAGHGSGEAALTMAGVVLVSIAHLKNLRLGQ